MVDGTTPFPQSVSHLVKATDGIALDHFVVSAYFQNRTAAGAGRYLSRLFGRLPTLHPISVKRSRDAYESRLVNSPDTRRA